MGSQGELARLLSAIDASDSDEPAADVPRGRGLLLLKALLPSVLGGLAMYGALALVVPDGDSRGGQGLDIIGLKEYCHTAVEGERCWERAVWARTVGLKLHPETYAGLTESSSMVRVQERLHQLAPEECPKPCAGWPTPDVACAPPLVPYVEGCHDAARGEECWDYLRWVMDVGLHPGHGLGVPSAVAELQGFVHKVAPAKCPKPCAGGMESRTTCICPPPQILGGDGLCTEPSGPRLMTFYMYRAQSDAEYPLENVNAADLAGVLLYLHNEIVPITPRKYGITRILRFRVTMMGTWPLHRKYHKQFGPFVAFDSARCTVPGCDRIWSELGFVVGCQNQDRRVANYVREDVEARRLWGLPPLELGQFHPDFREWPWQHGPWPWGGGGGPDNTTTSTTTTTPTTTTTVTTTTVTLLDYGYHGGTWYSLPGPCPSMAYGAKTPACLASMPGGRCGSGKVTGSPECTYHAEPAGEIRLDELVGVGNYTEFWLGGRGVEYDAATDRGVNCTFWDGKRDLLSCVRRMNQVRRLFREKYPELPDILPEPPCT